jgi:hypothetical protein
LTALQRDSDTNGLMTAQVAAWMEANGFLTNATAWLKTLPADVQTQLPVRVARVDCYLSEDNWPALRDFASKGSWGDWEYLRLAFLSRAWSQLGEPLVADGNWHAAVGLTDNQLGALNALLELAVRWHMKQAQEDLLWQILRKYPDATWAQHGLERLYITAGDTKSLYQLYAKRFARLPQSVELKNDLAYTALLLKTNVSKACQWAAEAYAKATNSSAVASTYAYALHLQDRDKDGLAAMQKLDKAALTQPSVALYYGVLLSAAGETNEAARYLKIAQTKGHLLPEEQQLLNQTLK